MTYEQFIDWMQINCPSDWDSEEFLEYLASRAAMIFDEGAKNNKLSTREFVSKLCSGQIDTFYTH